MASATLTDYLEELYYQRGKPDTFKDHPLDPLRSEAKMIFDRVGRKHPRFAGDLLDVGSWSVGLSSTHVDECDILLILDIKGEWNQDPNHPNYVQFQLKTGDPTWLDCATNDGLLHPRKVADLFHKYVKEVVSSLPGNPRISVSGDGTVATTISTVPVDFTIAGYKSLDIDLVVSVKCHGLPLSVNATWLEASDSWPSHEKVTMIKKEGFQLVAKSIYKGGSSSDTLWRLSLATAENILLRDIADTVDQTGVLCHKKLLIILKALRKNMLSAGPGTTPIISSYHLKTLLFHESHAHPSNSDWTKDKLDERFISAISYLYECVCQERLEHFFIPSVNLFEGRDVRGAVERVIKSLKDDPVACIKKILPGGENFRNWFK